MGRCKRPLIRPLRYQPIRRPIPVRASSLHANEDRALAGLRGLQGEYPEPLTCTVLYLDPGTGALRAYDEITLGGLGETEVTIQRTVVPPEDAGAPSDGAPASPTG